MEHSNLNKNSNFDELHHALTLQNKTMFLTLFRDMHPSDQVELTLSLSKKQRSILYHFISPAEFANIFERLELKEQKQYFAELKQNYAIELLNEMSTDDIVDFISQLPITTKELYLSKMNKAEVQDILKLLKYPEQTAGAIMTTEFISVSSAETVSEVMERLRIEGPDAETIYYLYVVDEELKLVGVLSLRDLIVASLDKPVQEIMMTRIVSVKTTEDQEEVAQLIKKYDFLALPVTENGKLTGIVTIDDVITVMEEEAEEDFGEILAVRGSMDANVSAYSAAKKRAPWIILLMLLGLITAGVIESFEETLAEVLVLAAFIPLIMGTAGNTGTQALAVVVRGLALGNLDAKQMKQMIRREFGTGIMLGFICAITLLIIIPIAYRGDIWLSLIVCSSIFLTLCLSTMVGAIIPLIINKVKIDPAVASGPFITTINDIMSLLIYFSVATLLLDFIPT